MSTRWPACARSIHQHLVRDARGVAYSSMKMVLRQGTDDDPYRVRRPPGRGRWRWMWINESFDRPRASVPSTLVRYETFVQHPADEIARIATEAAAPGSHRTSSR